MDAKRDEGSAAARCLHRFGAYCSASGLSQQGGGRGAATDLQRAVDLTMMLLCGTEFIAVKSKADPVVVTIF